MLLRIEVDLAPATIAILTDMRRQILHRLNRLERKMSEIDEHLSATDATLTAVSTTLTDVAADVQVLLDAGASGFTAEQRVLAGSVTARLAAVSTALAALDVAVGDRDGSDTPPPPPPGL